MKIEEIYTPLEIAREEILRRWDDKPLRRQVEEYLGGPPPEAVASLVRTFAELCIRQIANTFDLPNKPESVGVCRRPWNTITTAIAA